ncbi:MAG: GspH/FimT family pseudopilin [Betaproteobacteria bacterium]|nr:GspH/FimT family pseudopilin [Betaproteobacteria bacterium]
MRVLERGFTLVELLIGLAIVALMLFLGVPAFTTFLQNTQIRNAAETTLQGLDLARAEAVRLNQPVRFQFVSNFTSGCTLSATSLSWIVSLADPTGACNAKAWGDNVTNTSLSPAPSAPFIIEAKSAKEGSANVALATTGGSTLVFSGLGRLVSAGITQIDFTNPAGGTCTYADPTNGKMRCLRIQVSTSGQAKMCDPKVTDTTDPRVCN